MSDDREEFERRGRYHRWSLAAWTAKFRCAFRGWWLGSYSQTSFGVHYIAAIAVIILAFTLKCEPWEWGLLILCISSVMTAELVNSACEALARSISTDFNPHLRDALDIASGAVLVMSIGSAVIGCLIFLSKFIALWQ